MKIIKKISIHSYRQFKDLELNFVDNKGIYLFIGINGMGKTNLVNAIAWCLYEKEPFLSPESKTKEIISWHDEGGRAEVSILVESDDNIIKFTRTIEAGNHYSVFYAYKQNGEDWEKLDNPSYYVNQFLPESILSFFMINSEIIKQKFDLDYSHDLRDSIETVSGIKVISRAKDHLNKFIPTLLKNIGKLLPEIDALGDKINSINSSIESLKSDIKNCDDQISVKKNEITSFESKLEDSRKVQHYIEDRKNINENLDKFQEISDNYREDLNSIINANYAFVTLFDEMVEFKSNIEKEEADYNIPPDIASDIFQNILQQKIESNRKCLICDNTIDDKRLEQIRSMLEKAKAAEEKKFIIDAKWKISPIIENVLLLSDATKKIRKNILDVDAKIDPLKKQLAEISVKIESLGGEEGNIETTLNQYKDVLKDLEARNTINNADIKQKYSDLNDFQAEYDRKIKEHDAKNIENEKKKIAEGAVAFLSDILDKNIKDTIETLEKITSEYFLDIVWKKSEYKGIRINLDYEIEVIRNEYGLEKVRTPSLLGEGEKTILGYALMKALAMLSGYKDMPVFIDAPLSALATQAQIDVIKKLPEFMPDKQVFVLSLDLAAIEEFGRSLERGHFFRYSRGEDFEPTTIMENA